MSTQDLPQRELHQEITTQYLEYTTPLSNTNTSTQEVGTKPTQRKRNTLGDHKDHKQSLGDLERSQTQPLTIQDSRG